MLSHEEQQRYQRQIILNNIGVEGQIRLKKAKVLCVGAGGLGSSLCLYLASSGIGTLGIVDGDKISLNNLHRQILYNDHECGLLKTKIAAEKLTTLNPHCNVNRHEVYLTAENILGIIKQYDIIADCSDNFATRYLVNDACCQLKKTNVFASVQQYSGYCTVFLGKKGPCYRCLFPNPPSEKIPNCAQAGVLPITAGIMGLLQANEVVKSILNIGTLIHKKILIFDTLQATTKFINLLASPDCLICSKNLAYEKLPRYSANFVDDEVSHIYGISPKKFHNMCNCKINFTLVDVRTIEEFQQGHLENAIHIPIDQLGDSLQNIDRKKKIILYCQSDQRSRNACQLLHSNGFSQVFFIKGGLNNLESADLSIEN